MSVIVRVVRAFVVVAVNLVAPQARAATPATPAATTGKVAVVEPVLVLRLIVLVHGGLAVSIESRHASSSKSNR
jgi:hypothetical protein